MITEISRKKNELKIFISTCVLYLSDKPRIVFLDQFARILPSFISAKLFTKPRKTHLMKFPDLADDQQ